MLNSLIKKISLNKSIEEEDVVGIINDFWKQVKANMGKSDLNKIMIHNFVSFVPDKGKMKYRLQMCDYMMETYPDMDLTKIKELKETIEKNIDKPVKHKRCS